jgi:hypothetical protein
MYTSDVRPVSTILNSTKLRAPMQSAEVIVEYVLLQFQIRYSEGTPAIVARNALYFTFVDPNIVIIQFCSVLKEVLDRSFLSRRYSFPQNLIHIGI